VPRPRIVAVVAESVPAELPAVVAGRLPRVLPRRLRAGLAGRIFAAAADRLGADPRATEPIRVAPLVAPVPVLLIHGTSDDLVPVTDGERLAHAIGSTAERRIVPGGRHSRSRHADPAGSDEGVSAFLRTAFRTARGGGEDAGILAAARPPSAASGDAGADRSDQGG
jgi:pimeloyl-ACP methyl ester carboxylesterase